MKIGKKQRSERRQTTLARVILLLGVFVVGIILGQNNIVQAVQTAVANLGSVVNAGGNSLPTLIIDMPFANYNDTILRQRNEALSSGVYLGPEEDFANADIQFDGEQIPVRLRLQQGPASHLGDDEKWNLEVRTRDDRQLLGMQRFFLIDPADNNWLNEWAFMETLRREGLLAPRYHFVNLIFNGDDRGIYAVQEGFGAELMTSQGRQEGVLVEFDANLLWEATRQFEGDTAAALQDPVTNLSTTNFQLFEVDTFRDATIAENELLSAQKDAAIGLLRGLQSGELAASDVFDVELYGRFLAVVDLWGALEATSLLNIRFYYNPESGKLEPVGFNGNALGQDGRISLAATFDDPALQTAYSEAAARLSQPDYLNALQEALEPEWQTLQRAIRGEHNSTLPWDALAARQNQMQLSLAPLQPVFAYLGPPSLSMEAIIQVDVANVLNLPVEILGFDIDGATFLEVDPAWLRESDAVFLPAEDGRLILSSINDGENPVRFARFHLPLTTIVQLDSELDFMQEPEILVATRILGQERPQLTAARPGYPEPIVAASAGGE